MAAAKSLNYNFIEEKAPTEIYGDYEKIEITLFNLISNAFKFTPNKGSITIEITENVNDVSIIISDTGSGINENDIDTIFEKFYRLDSARSTNTGGAGLGLAIAQEIVTAHNGTISVESNPENTTFTVKLPS